MSNFVCIEVIVSLPWAREEKHYRYDIGRQQAEDALIPLPKDRELDPAELFEAQRQNQRRRDLIEMVSRQIAFALMNACESEDTVNGYRRKV
jgi:hypothetical protein